MTYMIVPTQALLCKRSYAVDLEVNILEKKNVGFLSKNVVLKAKVQWPANKFVNVNWPGPNSFSLKWLVMLVGILFYKRNLKVTLKYRLTSHII